jgi:hypothetical protein
MGSRDGSEYDSVTAGSSRRASPTVAGGAARPLEPDAIVAKFRDNARRALPTDRVATIERAALSLDSLDNVATLLTACRA